MVSKFQGRLKKADKIGVKYLFKDETTFCDIYGITIPKAKIREWVKLPGMQVEFPIAISPKGFWIARGKFGNKKPGKL